MVAAPPASAADAEVPLQVQAVFFKKIISFDQTLEGTADPKVVVLHADDAGADDVDAVLKAFRAARLNVSSAKASAAATSLNGVSVVYLLGSVASPSLKELCIKQQVLSMSGSAAHAVSGQVGIALGTKTDGKPEIIVNVEVVKSQGHRLSSSLLNLARVIQ